MSYMGHKQACRLLARQGESASVTGHSRCSAEGLWGVSTPSRRCMRSRLKDQRLTPEDRERREASFLADIERRRDAIHQE